MEVIDRLLAGFRTSSALMKIIWVNLGVFVLLRLLAIVGIFSGNPGFIDTLLPWVELPSSPAVLATRPWTAVTYMFAQWDLLHVVFNMLWLYWFGTIFMFRCNTRQLVTLYFMGGVAGGALYMLGYALLPLFHGAGGTLIGSSASVIAIVTAVAVLLPDFRMNLFLLGSVKIKWIAVATIVLVLIGVTGSNAGGEIAHLGGVAIGAVFALALKKGHDLSAPFSRLPRLRRPSAFRFRRGSDHASSSARPAPTMDGRSASATSRQPGGLSQEERRELDLILDKIKKSGYSSLTPSERDRLFSVSSKIK